MTINPNISNINITSNSITSNMLFLLADISHAPTEVRMLSSYSSLENIIAVVAEPETSKDVQSVNIVINISS